MGFVATRIRILSLAGTEGIAVAVFVVGRLVGAIDSRKLDFSFRIQ